MAGLEAILPENLLATHIMKDATPQTRTGALGSTSVILPPAALGTVCWFWEAKSTQDHEHVERSTADVRLWGSSILPDLE